MGIKIALPKGRLLEDTASLLHRAGWGFDDYHPKTRLYHLESKQLPHLTAKVFHEKDIPIQVAVGNYDLGICSLDWVEELLVKYPSLAVTKVRNLEYGDGVLSVVTSRGWGKAKMEKMQAKAGAMRIAGEYPNLAESFALRNRLRRFSIFPLWGAAEVYPPENAELALIPTLAGEMLPDDLTPVSDVLSFSAYLIANRISWEEKDLSQILASIEHVLPAWLAERKPEGKRQPSPADQNRPKAKPSTSSELAGDVVRLALPDGHQQPPTLDLLNKAGIQVDGYSANGDRRPTCNLEGVAIKVVRPQDMPLQVANGNFDLAITGRDWLREHLYQFPASPAAELLDLKFGWVRVVAVTSKTLPVTDPDSLRQFSAHRPAPIRVASEYVNIADKYARDNHLGMYRVIPTWGATEVFLPDDADLLIENTQTGRTIARHNLNIIDTLFESTACLIGLRDSIANPGKAKRINSMVETLRIAVEEN